MTRLAPTLADHVASAQARTVRIVEARPGGEFVIVEEFTIIDRDEAKRVATERQDSFDYNCQPRRAYVIDEDGIPFFAAGISDVGRAAMAEHAHEHRERRGRIL